MVIVVLHVATLLHASVTVQVIVDVPKLNDPLASAPVPLLEVAPVTVYVIVNVALQLSTAVIGGIVKGAPSMQKLWSAGQVKTGISVSCVHVIVCTNGALSLPQSST